MRIKIYDTVQDFLNSNEELLLENEAVTQLILHNAFNNKENKINKDIVFGRVEDEKNNIKIIFGNVKPFNLIIYDLDNNCIEAVKLLADYFIKENIYLRGINANKKVCHEFINYYEDKAGCTFKEHLAMDIMQITELNKDIILPEGNFREADLNDAKLIIDWSIKFIKEALNEDVTSTNIKDGMEAGIKNRCFYIFENSKGDPMAMIAATRQLVNGVTVGYVYSRKEARGKGYGLAAVANFSKEYLRRGNKFCTLFVDKKNPISNGVYKKVGYRIVEDNYDYRIVW